MKTRSTFAPQKTIYSGHPDLPAIDYEVENIDLGEFPVYDGRMIFEPNGIGYQIFPTRAQAEKTMKRWKDRSYCAALSIDRHERWAVYVWADARTDETLLVASS